MTLPLHQFERPPFKVAAMLLNDGIDLADRAPKNELQP